MSIRRKIFIAILAISATAVGCASAMFALNDHWTKQRSLSYIVDSQAAIIAQNSSAALAFLDIDAAQDVLSSLKSQEHIVLASIYDDKGKLFAQLQNRENIPVPQSLPQQQVNSPTKSRLALFEEIYLGPVFIGTLYIQADLNKVGISFASYSLTILFVLTGSMIIAWVLTIRAQGTITEPIAKIVDVARSVTEDNDYSVRAQKVQDDEIGDLVDGINEMLEQIQRRDNLLANQTEVLEQRVRERTAELEMLSNEFKHLAYHDPLTNLPNRAMYTDELARQLNRSSYTGEKLAVFFIDLDRFKNINDSLGHDIGDQLLATIAGRIANAVGDENCLARLGGDEFTIIVQDFDEEQMLGELAERVIKAIRELMIIDGNHLYVSASIGISIFPRDAEEADTLMKLADTAMYAAKEKGRNTYCFFTKSMNKNVTRKMQVEQNLRNAVRENELSVLYQPIVDAQTGDLLFIEALMRWNNKQLGEVGPEEFIAVAEDTGLIIPLGSWAFNVACSQLGSWRAKGLETARMSVNLSPRQLNDWRLQERMQSILEQHGLNGSDLSLELTESTLLSAPERAKEVLADFKNLGINISLDDFGTGYSSLSYLKNLPIDSLKIDRMFTANLDFSSEDKPIINAIVQLGHGLGLTVVAEGVETQSALEILKELNCDQAQGYLFARPMTSEQFETAYLNKQLSQTKKH